MGELIHSSGVVGSGRARGRAGRGRRRRAGSRRRAAQGQAGQPAATDRGAAPARTPASAAGRRRRSVRTPRASGHAAPWRGQAGSGLLAAVAGRSTRRACAAVVGLRGHLATTRKGLVRGADSASRRGPRRRCVHNRRATEAQSLRGWSQQPAAGPPGQAEGDRLRVAPAFQTASSCRGAWACPISSWASDAKATSPRRHSATIPPPPGSTISQHHSSSAVANSRFRQGLLV